MAVSWSWVYSRKKSPTLQVPTAEPCTEGADSSNRSSSWGGRKSLGTFTSALSSTSWGGSSNSSRGFLRENLRPWSREASIDSIISDLARQRSGCGVLVRTDAGITEHSSAQEAMEYLKDLRRPDKTDSDKKCLEELAVSEAERQALQSVLDAVPCGELVGLRVLVNDQYGTVQKVWHGADRVGTDFIVAYDSGKAGMLPRIDASHVLSCDVLSRIYGCPAERAKRSHVEESTNHGSMAASSDMTLEHSIAEAELDTTLTFGELTELPEKEREVLCEVPVEPALVPQATCEHAEMPGPVDLPIYLPTYLPKEEMARKVAEEEASRKAADEAAAEAARKEAEQSAAKKAQAASSEVALEHPTADAKLESALTRTQQLQAKKAAEDEAARKAASESAEAARKEAEQSAAKKAQAASSEVALEHPTADAKLEITLTRTQQLQAKKAAEDEAVRKAASESAEAARKAEETAKVSDRAAFWETKIRMAGS